MRCHECGAENDPSSHYCHNCSAPLAAVDDVDAGEMWVHEPAPSDPYVSFDAVDARQGDALPDATTQVPHTGSQAISTMERSRHMRVPTASNAKPDGPAGIEADGRQGAGSRGGKPSALKRLLLVIINASFILGISYLPWGSFQSVAGGAWLTAPELSMSLLETVSRMISGDASPTVNRAFVIGILAFAVWSSTIYCSAGDIYYDAVGRRRVHAGVVNAIVVSLATMGGSLALDVSGGTAAGALGALFDASVPSAATLTTWPPVMLGVASLGLLIDLVVE